MYIADMFIFTNCIILIKFLFNVLHIYFSSSVFSVQFFKFLNMWGQMAYILPVVAVQHS